MKITVYGKPGCVQCKYSCKELDKLIEKGHLPHGYEYLDVTTDPAAAETVREKGYYQLPLVVITRGEQVTEWSGFHREKLQGLAVDY